ncbi:transcriptional regulator, MarR family [Quadrisphaera granulorum]|uniref:MarR family transcriptional regulator n=2 Tax=Quadrisphaera granulorum TaxID=317664 RepID=A0A316AC87_9ACTN|nr:MarR family transcriptional regulator [Quadrisphaera granulorum]SZE95711.1 transcriptional regulator, MarR family [Quadrisphaera granulorum]
MTYAHHMTSARCRPAPLAAELRVGAMRLARRLRRERSSTDITDTQYSVLAALDRRGPQTLRALADHENVQPPSMTRTVTALEEAGLARRTPHPDDGRQLLVVLTEAGTRHVHETRRRRDAWLAEQLAALSLDDRAALARAAALLQEIATR